MLFKEQFSFMLDITMYKNIGLTTKTSLKVINGKMVNISVKTQ